MGRRGTLPILGNPLKTIIVGKLCIGGELANFAQATQSSGGHDTEIVINTVRNRLYNRCLRHRYLKKGRAALKGQPHAFRIT